MTIDASVSLTHRTGNNRPSASLKCLGGGQRPHEVVIGSTGRTGPHALLFECGDRWVMVLVGCHRELEVSFRHLSDAARVAETLVETAVLTKALAYDADPLLLEASA